MAKLRTMIAPVEFQTTMSITDAKYHIGEAIKAYFTEEGDFSLRQVGRPQVTQAPATTAKASKRTRRPREVELV